MKQLKKIAKKITNIFAKKNSIELVKNKLTPPKGKNWNQSEGELDYVEQFSFNFINYYYPYILRNCREFGVDSDCVALLDIGCGWGPMAIPFAINEISKNNNELNGIRYLGIDIREDAIGWLIHAYADYPFIKFQHHKAEVNADYIRGESEKSDTTSLSTGSEAAFDIPKSFVHNVQWSSSVFTHLTPQACRTALETIKKSSAKNSIQINTWLIIDDESRYALTMGLADRELPFDCGEYLTYSVKNPLVCTAYKINAIRSIYKDAGLEILKIDRGAWRGLAAKNTANHYQDIITSRPISGS